MTVPSVGPPSPVACLCSIQRCLSACLPVCLCVFVCCLCRSLSSKVISQHTSLMSPMAVDAVLRVIDPQQPNLLDLRDIRVVCKVCGDVGVVCRERRVWYAREGGGTKEWLSQGSVRRG